MIEDITPSNFETVLGRKTGYIVNVWPDKRTAKAHNLAHLHGACCSTMLPVEEYPKFFASTVQEARDYAKAQHNVDCDLCRLCESAGQHEHQ